MGIQIAQKEGVLSLYKGLGAVISGIVPKMAIRFSSFEYYKEILADKKTGQTHTVGVFLGNDFLWNLWKIILSDNSWFGCRCHGIRHGCDTHGCH